MRKKILVIDDDQAIGDVVQLILEDAGYKVEIHTDGHTVQHMREPFPDLLLLDIRLSGADGQMICWQLKQQEATQHIPIILLSAHEEMQRMARDAGADHCLAKPFEMEELLALVAKSLGNE
ncbi:MAG: response regulator transcription factor [Chloroflexota bacterium]|nr:response regulator transcription factor [Chloroflexota bacterium]